MRVSLAPSRALGTAAAPPSKSMAHRALICAALAQGESVLYNVAPSQDILATMDALRALGAGIEACAHTVRVRGIGGAPRRVPAAPVDCRESGSTLRFLVPLFALSHTPVQFCGSGRLPERPQSVYAELFRRQGLPFAQNAQGVRFCGPLRPGEYCVEGGVSSQFISGLLFALPLLGQDSTVHITPPFESRSYVRLTQQAMADFGVRAVWNNENTISITGNQKYTNCNYTVEGDYSQAAFFAVLGAVAGGVSITGLRPDSLQGDRAVLEVLRRCGARFSVQADRVTFAQSALRAVPIDLADCPDLGPVLMVLGLFCEGETVLVNAGRLRMKESDRIAAMEQEAAKLGGHICSEGGTVRVRGGALHAAADLDSHNDHRIAMALAVAALGAGVPVSIGGAQAVSKSYPEFWRDLAALGAEVHTDETA